MILATVSVGPPAANGTIMVMGRSGYSLRAGPTAAKQVKKPMATDANRRVMALPHCLVCWPAEPCIGHNPVVIWAKRRRRPKPTRRLGLLHWTANGAYAGQLSSRHKE